MRLALKTILRLCLVFSLSAAMQPVTAADHTIEIVNFAFVPAELSIQPGDTVTWVNRDFVPHNVAGVTENSWRSPDLKKDDVFSIVLLEDLSYICTLHPASMTGLVITLEEKQE